MITVVVVAVVSLVIVDVVIAIRILGIGVGIAARTDLYLIDRKQILTIEGWRDYLGVSAVKR